MKTPYVRILLGRTCPPKQYGRSADLIADVGDDGDDDTPERNESDQEAETNQHSLSAFAGLVGVAGQCSERQLGEVDNKSAYRRKSCDRQDQSAEVGEESGERLERRKVRSCREELPQIVHGITP